MVALSVPHSLPRWTVALAGNPNSGKTTLFNALTGLRYKVANYPGVTVEKREGRIVAPTLDPITLIDLPGIYSLEGHSLDERIATQALRGELNGEPLPTAAIAVVDASNLERNLYLVTQLIDFGIPLVIALTMTDLAEKRGLSVKREILGRLLDVPVVRVLANQGQGLQELKDELQKLLTNPRSSSKRLAWRDPNAQHFDPAIEASSFEATNRYRWINSLVRECVARNAATKNTTADLCDTVLTHHVWGVLVFLVLMAVIFQSIFLWAKIPMDAIDATVSTLGTWLKMRLPEGVLRSLLVDGIIAGVGSVLVFIPQIAILIFFLGLLEDSGYLARASFLMDRIMRHVGLQGRSFIPLLSSFACAIPGIMSTRTIPSARDRLITILVAPLMSCSARLPVYAVLIAAAVPEKHYYGVLSLQGGVLLAMYCLGVMGAAAVAFVLKRFLLLGEPTVFVMEMPPFRLPFLGTVLRDVWDRVKLFVTSAGTMILACSVLLWFLASFPSGPIERTLAGRIGKFCEPLLEPLGYNWEIGVGILASFAAREVFVSSLATVYNLQDSSETTQSLIMALNSRHAAGEFTLASALSLMVFYVFACQCMSTLAVCRRETGSWRWSALMFTYMTLLAYGAAFATYQAAIFFLR